MNQRLIRFGILLSCFAVAVAVRISNFEFVFRDYTGHLNFIDTDCYYYLRRLVHFLTQFPNLMMFDPLSDWPEGSWVAWPEGFLLLLGIPLKIFQVSDFKGLELGVSFIMLSLGLFCCSIALMSAQRVIQNFYLCVLVFFLTSVNFLLVRFSCLGQVDHHILEATFPPLMLWLADKSFSNEDRASPYLLGFVLAFSLLISSSSLFVVGAFFSIYIFVYGRKDLQKRFLAVCATFFLLLLPYAVWSVSVRGDSGSVTHPSYFHLLLILVLTAVAWTLVQFSRWKFWLFLGSVVLSIALYLLQWPVLLMRPIYFAFDYVFGRSGVLQNVSEAAPIYKNYSELNFDFMHLNFGYLVWILPAIWVSLFFWKKWNISERAFLLSLSILSIPGVFQKRFSQLMVAGFLVFLVWVVYRIHLNFSSKWKWSSSFAAVFVLVFTCLPLLQYGFAPMGSPRDAVDQGAVSLFIKRANIKEADVWNRLSGEEKVVEGIWANPNMGHLLLYTTGYGIVTNSFYFQKGFDVDFKLRTLESEEDFRNELKKNRIRYILLADDFIFLDMQFKMHGNNNAGVISYREQDGRMRPVVQMDFVQRYAWARILMQDWETLGFEKLFSVRFNEPHFYTFVKGLRFKEF